MPANRRSLTLLVALVAAVATGLAWQRQTTTKLRGEIARQRAEGRGRAQLRTENQRLASAQPTAEELDALLAERAAVAQLRTELDSLRRRALASATTRQATAPKPAPVTPPLTGNVLAHPLWQNLGAATPAAAFETTLWASAGGDIDALAGLLALDPEARTEALALFAHLPEKLRQEFVSPERLVAVLTAKDVPLGSATILGQYPSPADTKLAAQIFDAEGQQKISLFSLRAEGDRWRLVVPGNAVKRYAAWLRAPPAAAGAPP
jgi:hypothetical protein